jgi:quercetin dioxygenase-like cupin family protein
MTSSDPASMTDIEDLAAEVPAQPGRTTTRRVLKADGVRLVVLAFDAGQALTEHTAAVPILIQVLAGRVSVTADGRAVDLRPGGVIHIDRRLPHAVRAAEPATVLLTLLDQATGAATATSAR